MQLRHVEEPKWPDCCANCVSLAWGDFEGWDKCRTHGIGIAWCKRRGQVCDDHQRSPHEDPRNAFKIKQAGEVGE